MAGTSELKKPDHWKDLLDADASEPYFFQFAMMIPEAAEDVASSETAMHGVFTYDKE